MQYVEDVEDVDRALPAPTPRAPVVDVVMPVHNEARVLDASVHEAVATVTARTA